MESLGSLRIRNFNCFTDLTLETIGRVNLIAGKNNVGKTMLLDAISVYASGADPRRLFQVIDRRNQTSSDGKLFWAARNFVALGGSSVAFGPRMLEIQIPAPTLAGNPNSQPPWVELRANPRASSSSSVFLTIDGEKFAYDLTTDARNAAISDRYGVNPKVSPTKISFQSTMDLQNHPPLFRHLWDELVDGRRAEQEVIDFLKLLELQIASITLPSGPIMPRIRLQDQDELVPISVFGDGLTRLFTLSMALVGSKGGFLLIDEVENGLHYSIFPKLWKFLFEAAERSDVTVFATTHSYDAAAAFSEVAFKNEKLAGVLTRLDQRKNGIVAVQYTEGEAFQVTEEGLEVR